MGELVVVKGYYMEKIFFDAASGYASFYMKPLSYVKKEYIFSVKKYAIKVVGPFCLEQVFMPLSVKGKWEKTSYGYELKAEDIELESSNTGTDSALLSGLGIKDQGMASNKIVRETGGRLIQRLSDPMLESSIIAATNANEETVCAMLAKLRELVRKYKVFQLMNKNGGSYEVTEKVLKAYPSNAYELLLTDPYSVLNKVPVPFDTIDSIAKSLGIDPLSESRINAIVGWSIKKETTSGNTFVTFPSICKMIQAKDSTIPSSSIMASLKNHPYIVHEEENPDNYYLKQMLKDEISAAQDFWRLMLSRVKLPVHPEYIDMIEKKNGRKFGAQQRSSFSLMTTTGIKILTGGPGTGKSTTANGLLEYLEMVWEDKYGVKPVFALCAPSGRAAQRLKETTGRNALTVHKLIEFTPFGDGEYYKNSNDPIEADIIVCDEVSMLGLSTFCKLINAIKNARLFLLIGDTDQLQSVEPGNVLYDIIHCGYVEQCDLKEVFRQAEDSLININAKKIIEGREDLQVGPDFEIYQTVPEQTEKFLTEKVQQLILEAGDKNRVQVLAPLKKGTCGINQGNTLLQKIFNPEPGGIWYGYRNYRVNDRVIMRSNNYALNYFNGDVGYITKITPTNMVINIGNDYVTVPREKYGDMDLAYNCTIHKSQGSEYDYLIVVLQKESKNMLNRNLFYTAVTRGKKKVVVIYEEDLMQVSIRVKNSNKRNSGLIWRIQNEGNKLLGKN